MHAFSPLCTAQHVPRTLGLRCVWDKIREEIEDCSCTYNHTSNLKAVHALGSGFVALRNDPNLDEIRRKLSRSVVDRPSEKGRDQLNLTSLAWVVSGEYVSWIMPSALESCKCQSKKVHKYGLTGLLQPKLRLRNPNQAHIITYTSRTDGPE
jgi:hypothetical protein